MSSKFQDGREAKRCSAKGCPAKGFPAKGCPAKGCPKYIFTTFHVQNYEHKDYQVGGDNLVIIALGF